MKSDRRRATHCFVPPVLFSVTLALSQGCTALSEGFIGSEQEEIAPFARATIEVIGVGDIILREDELVYLRSYTRGDFPELTRLQDALARVDGYRDAVIIYAVDMVRVTELYETDEGKVNGFADSVESQLGSIPIERDVISESEWNGLIANVRAQPDLLAALRAFQPFVNRSSAAFEQLVSEIEDTMIPALRAEFDRRIQDEFKEMLAFLEMQYEIRDDMLAGMTALHRHRYGDGDAIAEFRSAASPIAQEFFAHNSYSEDDLLAIDNALRRRLGDSSILMAQIEEDIRDYEQTRAELDAAEAAIYAELGIARLQIITWSRAHQDLANGVREPGKWMESTLKAAKLVKDIVK